VTLGEDACPTGLRVLLAHRLFPVASNRRHCETGEDSGKPSRWKTLRVLPW
jgi:hypothetical protein